MKNPLKDPLKHRGLFLRISFVIALVLVILAFQWKLAYEIAPPNGPKGTIDEIMPAIRSAHEDKKMPDAKEMEKRAHPKKSPRIRVVGNVSPDDNDAAPNFDMDDRHNVPVLPPPPIDDEIKAPMHSPSEMPSFPGGRDQALQFIADHLKYPEYEYQIGLEGTVYVEFVIDRTGHVSEIKIQRSPSQGFSREAIRVLKLMPRWNPGRHNGRYVPVYYQLPIRFALH